MSTVLPHGQLDQFFCFRRICSAALILREGYFRSIRRLSHSWDIQRMR